MGKEGSNESWSQPAQLQDYSRRRALRVCRDLGLAILGYRFLGFPTPVEAAGPGSIVHMVKRGETLSILARRYLGDANLWSVIAKANELKNPNLIFSGQKLIIPDSTSSGIPESQKYTEKTTSLIQRLAPIYLASAEKNRVPSARGEVIIPSSPYRNGIYCRDALWGTLGLDDFSLMHNCYRWFAETQLNNGQIRSAVAFNPEDHSLQPQDDESTLLFLIWSGVLRRKGTPIDVNTANKALGFIRAHIKEGDYISPPGPFRYWLDTLSQTQETRITYNQGLWALGLRFAKEIDLPVSQEEINLAGEAYRSGYRSYLGFVSQSKETNWQDISSLLPEFLSRWLLSEKILTDEMVVSTVDYHLKTAGVYQVEKLVGIKNISHPDGSFLSPGHFAIRCSEKGDYQNGGYWPMYTLVESCLAYQITKNEKYKHAVAQLIEEELKDGQGAKEFLSLRPGRVGWYPPETAGYSWNALVYQALRWSGML